MVDVTVKEIHYLKGPFSAYSAKFTGISNVITENKTVYFVEDIKLKTFSVPDTSRLFFIETSKLKNKDNFMINFNDYGCISSVNIDLSEEYYDKNKISEKESDNLNHPSNSGFEYFATGNTRIKTDTIFEKIILDTVTIEKQILQHSIIEKSIEDKAKDAADYIRLISENKMNLISGYQEINYDLNTFDAMLEELNKMQKEYLTLFTGKAIEYSKHYLINIDPDKINEKTFIFSFSESYGVLEDYDSLLSDELYYYELVSDKKSNAIKSVITNTKHYKNKGIAYNIPEDCVFILNNEAGEVVLKEKVPICQLGITNYLPSSIKNVLFDTNSGAIRMLKK